MGGLLVEHLEGVAQMTEETDIYDRLTKPRIVGWEREPPTTVSPIHHHPWPERAPFRSIGLSGPEFYRKINGLPPEIDLRLAEICNQGDRICRPVNADDVLHAVRSGETQWAGKEDDPDAKPDDDRFEQGRRWSGTHEADLKERIMADSKSEDIPPTISLDDLMTHWKVRDWIAKAPRHDDHNNVLDALSDESESAVIDRHLATEQAECEHVALFTLKDSLTDGPTESEAVITARLLLLYLMETR